MKESNSFPNKPGFYIMEIGHDDGCPMLSGGDHCTCKTTTSEVVPFKQWKNRKEKRKAESEARQKKTH